MTHADARPNPHRPPHDPPLDPARVGIRTKLSALWAAVMFLYVYVDIFSLFKPGTIDDILIGRVWTLDITQTWALSALILMSVPTLMLVLTLTLPAAAARWANVVVAALYVIVSLFNAVGETWLYSYFGAAVETVLLVLVVRYAWTWPRRHEAVAARATADRLDASTPHPASI